MQEQPESWLFDLRVASQERSDCNFLAYSLRALSRRVVTEPEIPLSVGKDPQVGSESRDSIE